MLYPSLTSEISSELSTDNKKYFNFLNFFIDLAKEMNLESIILPVYHDLNEIVEYVSKRNLQLIPLLNLRESTNILTKKFEYYVNKTYDEIPIISFSFSTYRRANKGYNLVMDNLDTLHEKGKATLMLDIPRFIKSNDYYNISAPHYGPFFIADLVAERYIGQSGRRTSIEKKERKIRIFYKEDLTVPLYNFKERNTNQLDIENEINVFNNDTKLKEFMKRVIEGNMTDMDWSNYRPSYLSRIHENIRTREEFIKFQKHIESNTPKEYLTNKKSMNNIVSTELKTSNRL